MNGDDISHFRSRMSPAALMIAAVTKAQLSRLNDDGEWS
jgi:hypothetical protein